MSTSLPCPAERARTALAASPTLDVVAGGVQDVVGRHGTDRWGRPTMLVDGASGLAATARAGAPAPMLVRAAALRPIEVPDRIRARVELCGYLELVTAVPSGMGPSGMVLLRGEVLSVTLDEASVDPDAYAGARSDPHVDRETEVLRRLGHHPAALAERCARAEPATVEAATEIGPSGVDRHGLTVWLAAPGWTREIRLPFPYPVDDPSALQTALTELLAPAPAH